jgi:hypothetical protein
MAGERRVARELERIWPAGEYTLLADSHTAEDRVTYSKGATLTLSQGEATRLGNSGVISPPGGMHAVRARVESGQGNLRDEYLYQMWELTEAWEPPGRV